MPIVEVGFAGVPGVQDPAGSLELIGPTLAVEIGFDPNVFAQLSGLPAPPSGALPVLSAVAPQVVPALVDTGAQQSMIDEILAQQLALPIINQQPFSGVGGPGVANVYLAHINIAVLGTVQYGAFMGAHLQAGGQAHQALIGRTLLRGVLLVYDGDRGSVRIAR